MKITEMAAEGVHQKCYDLISGYPKGKLLDIGSGEGAFVRRVYQNFEVTASDINKNQFKLSDCKFLEIDYNSNFKVNEQYDYITCIEIIEHLENPHKLIRDCNSLLKKGGVLILTTPNIESTYSKLLFLVKGHFKHFAEEDKKYGHINPLTYSELGDILIKNGFTIECLEINNKIPYFSITNGFKSNLLGVLSMLVQPLIRCKHRLLKRGDVMIIKAQKR